MLLRISYLTLIATLNLLAFQAQAHLAQPLESSVPVLADLNLLQRIGAPVISKDAQINLGYAYLSPQAQVQMSLLAHQYGKCGGFEVVQDQSSLKNVSAMMQNLKVRLGRDYQYSKMPFRAMSLPQRPEIVEALKMANTQNLQNWVSWLSSFPNRYNKASDPNVHVLQLKQKLEQMLAAKGRRNSATVDLVDHRATKQKSIRLRLVGTTRPEEIIVMGGHLDSINLSGGAAPGADDNASGSSNLLEALRIVLSQPRMARTIEFMWYAGEESGLLGSAEIAAAYKEQKANVVAVLQLDMTLFPGAGEMVLGSMTDFTSAWMRELLTGINANYLNVKIVEDRCGYGCSDHASWYRQGYPTLMPFEATMRTMNKNIHTTRDVVTPQMSWNHSLVFTKIAVALAMELGNNPSLKQPY